MSELDDFFAKKDKKKSKGKKFIGSEDKGKGKSDEVNKKVDKSVKKERIPREDGDDTSNPNVQEVDEWREFEEEKKDYSGLKLGHLSISENTGGEGGTAGCEGGDDGSTDGGDGEDGCHEGEGGNSERGFQQQQRSGPWKRFTQPNQAKEQNAAAAATAAAVNPTTNQANGQQQHVEAEQPQLKRATGAYIPPSLRNQQARGPLSSGGVQTLQPIRMRAARATAPDIHNEDYFPTLAAGGPGGAAAGKDKQGAFEVVSHGRGGNAAQPRGASAAGALRSSTVTPSAQQLTLGNRFNTLSHNDS